MSAKNASSNFAGLSFRIARERDLSAIITLLADDELGAKREDASAAAHDAYAKSFDAITADRNNDIIIAELDGAVVGCLQLTMLPGLTYTGGTRAQLEGIRVARALRGKSVGRRLIADAIERARKNGAFMVQLTSTKSRQSALKFYEDLGFTPSHTGFKLRL